MIDKTDNSTDTSSLFVMWTAQKGKGGLQAVAAADSSQGRRTDSTILHATPLVIVDVFW